MSLRRLEVFVATAEELHFNRAARRLHMAQPSLSQQIQKLEQEYGVALLERDTRNVRLTPAGEVLLNHARKLLTEYQALETAVEHARDGRSGTVRLGFVTSAAINTIPRVASAVGAGFPEVRLELHEMTTTPQINAIKAGELDLGIAREVHPIAELDISVLHREPLLVAVPQSHRLATSSRVRLRELQGEQFIAFPRQEVSRLFDHIGHLLNSVGVEFVVAQEAVQFPTILGLVAAGRGIAIVPECMRALALPGVRYLGFADQRAVSEVSLIRRHRTSPHPTVVDRIIDVVIDAAGRPPGRRTRASADRDRAVDRMPGR